MANTAKREIADELEIHARDLEVLVSQLKQAIDRDDLQRAQDLLSEIRTVNAGVSAATERLASLK